MTVLGLVLLSLLFSCSSQAQFLGITDTPFSTDEPNWINVKNRLETPLSLWGVIGKPYPTNQFYTSVALGSYPIPTHPYVVKPYSSGIYICYPSLLPQQSAVTSTWHDDLLIYSSSLENRMITDHTMLGVTVTWSGTDNTKLDIPIVQGSPYITAVFRDTTRFNVSMSSNIRKINGVTPPTDSMECYTSEKFTLDLVFPSGYLQSWVIWSLTDQVTFCYVPRARIGSDGAYYPVLMANTTSTRIVLRIAALVNTSDLVPLDKYKSTIVVGGDVRWNQNDVLDDNITFYTFSWKSILPDGSPYKGQDVLMMGLPHHMDIIDRSLTVISTEGYNTSRGRMIGFAGAQWKLWEPLSKTTWFAARPVDPSKIPSIRYEMGKDMWAIPLDNDTYGFGKYVAQIARLALIAEEINATDLQPQIIDRIKFWLAPWLNRVTYRSTFLYDTIFGGTISADGWLLRGVDYGNGIYADHHFHYGYYIYAGAVVLKYDPSWEWGPRLIDLVRDIANPSHTDPFFTVTRHKDWYNSHSWAQGLEASLDGKNQESTSEAVNCYYAIALLGVATKNNYVRNFGRLLLASEMRGAQKYWQMSDSSVYPPIFSQNKMVGIVWGDKADYSTWFKKRSVQQIRIEHIHCIQMLPFTPITEELLRYSYVVEEFKVLQVVLQNGYPITEEWKTYVFMDNAIFDPVGTWKYAQLLNNDGFGRGNSRTNTYWWIATRPTNPAVEEARQLMEIQQVINSAKYSFLSAK